MVDLARTSPHADVDRSAAIRRALRTCDHRRVLALLAGVTDLPPGQPTPAEIEAYARDRLAHRSPGPSRRLPREARQAPPLPGETLQRVLRWATADELRAGEAALAGHQLNRAIASFERALRIDGRGSRASLLLATALHHSVERELSTQDSPDLDRTYEDLDQATALVGRAALDPRLRARAAELSPMVDGLRQRLVGLRQHRTRARALNEYTRRYKAFMARYGRSRLTMAERSQARRSLATYATDLNRLRPLFPTDSPEAAKLAAIAKEIADMQHRFRNVV